MRMKLLMLLMLLFSCNYYEYQLNYTIQKPKITHIEQIKEDKFKLILITLDGVRWQEIFHGVHGISPKQLVPNLYTYFHDGMILGNHEQFVASGPNFISLPGYLEILRGKQSYDCQSNFCDPEPARNISDYFETSAVFSSWTSIHKIFNTDIYINSGRNYRSNKFLSLNLLEDFKFKQYFSKDYRPDILTQNIVFKYLEIMTPDFLWVSLGDTDEWGHIGDFSKYIDSLKFNDAFIGSIYEKYHNTHTIIITSDHRKS